MRIPAGAFGALLGRLQAYVVDWQNADAGYNEGPDRYSVPLDQANVVSSLLQQDEDDDGFGFVLLPKPRHVVAIDLDHPAYLVPSSTPGHSRLYIDVPGGIPHEKYMALLDALADAGVIEVGYAEVSKARGHTDLRVPWESKHAPTIYPFDPFCGRPASAIADIVAYAEQEELTPARWVEQNEGTYNRQNGHFACTECYIKLGQPAGPAGWVAP